MSVNDHMVMNHGSLKDIMLMNHNILLFVTTNVSEIGNIIKIDQIKMVMDINISS